MLDWLVRDDPVPNQQLAALASRHALLCVSSTLHGERAASDLVATVAQTVKHAENEAGFGVRDAILALHWAFEANELVASSSSTGYEPRQLVTNRPDLVERWLGGDTTAARELWATLGYDVSAWPDELFPVAPPPRRVALTEISLDSLVDESVMVLMTGDRILSGRLLALRDDQLLVHTELAPEEAAYALPTIAVVPRDHILAVGLFEEALPSRLLDELDARDDS